MADLARNASFPEEEFERERRQKLRRVEESNALRPAFSRASDCAASFSARTHMPSLRPRRNRWLRYAASSLRNSIATIMSPSDALLIVVGDFSTDAMFEQVEKVFGSWKASQPRGAAWPAPPRQSGRRVHLVHLPGTVQTQVLAGQSGHHAPRSRLVSPGPREFDLTAARFIRGWS